MTIYAKAPDDLDPAHADYLTPGREYPVLSDNGRMFVILDDNNDPTRCHWRRCPHLQLSSTGWQCIEREETEA